MNKKHFFCILFSFIHEVMGGGAQYIVFYIVKRSHVLLKNTA